MKLRISKPNGLYYSDIREAVDKLFEAEDDKKSKAKGEKPSKDKKPNKNIKKKMDHVPGVPDSIKPTFPMDFILRKFPELKSVLDDLLTVTFKDYIKNIFVVAPKPTTFKVLLKNDQWFLLIYNERSYVVKAAGKRYYLLNLGEKQRAIQAIADLLITKNFLSSNSPEEENSSTGPDSESSSKSKSSGGGSSGSSAGSDAFSSEDLDSILGSDDETSPEGGAESPESGEEESPEEPLSENIIIRLRR